MGQNNDKQTVWHTFHNEVITAQQKVTFLTTTGCKENRFYSLPFGQAQASIY